MGYSLPARSKHLGSWLGTLSSLDKLCLAQEEGAEEGEEGLGVTQVTSKARLWLARYLYMRGEWAKVMELANELCQDGVEVEEAKGLAKDVRARLQLSDGED